MQGGHIFLCPPSCSPTHDRDGAHIPRLVCWLRMQGALRQAREKLVGASPLSNNRGTINAPTLLLRDGPPAVWIG
jgi:hypothetical protein